MFRLSFIWVIYIDQFFQQDGYNLKHEIAIGAKRDAWSSDEDE